MLRWFWRRPLLPSERDFVRQYFGAALDARLPSLRLYLRRVGDTGRALSFNGGRISLPRACFAANDPRQPLRLDHPRIAGLFAHELLHQWQRAQGLPVTRQALWLQLRMLLGGHDPYAYERCSDPVAMQACFASAQVEQQGQIWEDHVRACVAGQPAAEFALIAAEVRASPR
ncbi:hypothetical protein [Comamonas endophytica]|uniref:SprT-like family protein n=1 Tax=Comamonas endophytica TaxID=2949090 RepID=A0ABY6G9Y9_9BURK|nr:MULTISPECIES: hypothetical protein [unclassified Acidovorax]MCD2512069.1 hypothetical protein [Acidovorax sp. D4N7]UYG51849.1 hypothetical protein M9799_00895 [Acidovorax sp. 5MLIR]